MIGLMADSSSRTGKAENSGTISLKCERKTPQILNLMRISFEREIHSQKTKAERSSLQELLALKKQAKRNSLD